MTDEQKVTTMVRDLQIDNTLIAFQNISNVIQKATGLLPKRVIPIVQRLCDSYSKTTIVVKVGLADTCAVLSKFIIKSYRIMQRGINDKDRTVLIALANQLNTDIINKLKAFVESSRTDLLEIHSQLLLEASGVAVENLLKMRHELEVDLLQRSEELAKKAAECAVNKGTIASLAFQKEIFEKTLVNSMGTKEETIDEINRLKELIPEYENEIQQHRDTSTQERESLWIFSWKVRDIHHDNGERIARENLNRLIERIRILEGIVGTWSDIDLVERVAEITNELAILDTMKTHLTEEYALIKQFYDEVETKFYATIEEINQISQSVGTVDVNSMKMIDELCRAVQIGQESIVSAYGKMQTHLQTIDVDEDFLLPSVLDALQLINMADPYMGTAKIQSIRQVLAIQ